MSVSTTTKNSPGLRPLAATFALVCASAVAWYVGAQQPAAVQMGPTEFALRAYMGPITDRVGVRDGPAKTDIWLFSSVSFEEAAERARKAISSRKELPGEVRIARWTYIEPTRSYWLDIEGKDTRRVHLSRHLSGTLLVLHGAGTAKDAPRWSPPYRPLPIDLPHGPVR